LQADWRELLAEFKDLSSNQQKQVNNKLAENGAVVINASTAGRESSCWLKRQPECLHATSPPTQQQLPGSDSGSGNFSSSSGSSSPAAAAGMWRYLPVVGSDKVASVEASGGCDVATTPMACRVVSLLRDVSMGKTTGGSLRKLQIVRAGYRYQHVEMECVAS
jgi:hypothetical protein